MLHGLRPRHVHVLEVLRQFARSNRLVWLRGNHDPDEVWCREVLDLETHDELVVSVGRRRYLICHGHVWDRTLSLPSVVVHGADWVYHARAAHRFVASPGTVSEAKHEDSFVAPVDELRRAGHERRAVARNGWCDCRTFARGGRRALRWIALFELRLLDRAADGLRRHR